MLGSVVAAVAIAIALIHITSGTPSHAAPSTAPHASAGTTTTPADEPAPVVTPADAGASSYLADMNPSGDLAGSVSTGRARIAGSIYPKSISFYCNVGDPTAFPVYKLRQDARRFEATIGLAATSPPQFEATLILLGDGRTLRTVNVGVPKPKTVDVGVRGVHSLQLECFGSGNSVTGGEAVAVAWGNARVQGGD